MEILLIDDDPIWYKIFRYASDNIGFPVNLKYAANGVEARKLLRRYCPNVIFLDLTMPVEDGPEFLEKTKHLNIPTFILSSSHVQKDMNLVNEYDNIVSYYHKPLEVKQLMEILTRIKINELWKLQSHLE